MFRYLFFAVIVIVISLFMAACDFFALGEKPTPVVVQKTVIAGRDAASGFAGEGGLATSALLNSPWGIAVDSDGNLYIADRENKRIRKVDKATNIITTVAGGIQGGVPRDSVPATSTRLRDPVGIALDPEGHLYIADRMDNIIYKVDATTNIITFFAGTGDEGFSGDDGMAIHGTLNGPWTIAISPDGHVYIADTDNFRIRKVDAVTNIISTVVGTGEGGYSGDDSLAINAKINRPTGLSFDQDGNLYFSDMDNARIRKLDVATNIITTVVGTGEIGFSGDGAAAINAQLNLPSGIAIDSNDNIFIADRSNDSIRRVDASSGDITSFSTNPDSISAPVYVALSGSNIFYSDHTRHAVFMITLNIR